MAMWGGRASWRIGHFNGRHLQVSRV
jgi:hypothetical protein